jgi:hypothetical protein
VAKKCRKGTKNYLILLEEALTKEAKKAGITYWEQLAKWCFVNPMMASSVLKKFIPDMQKIEHDIPEGRKIIIEHIGNNKQLQSKSN